MKNRERQEKLKNYSKKLSKLAREIFLRLMRLVL